MKNLTNLTKRGLILLIIVLVFIFGQWLRDGHRNFAEADTRNPVYDINLLKQPLVHNSVLANNLFSEKIIIKNFSTMNVHEK